MPKVSSNEVRLRIHKRIRKHLSGAATRPRLAVFRNLNHIYAQVIDDVNGKTLAAASTTAKATPDREKLAANVTSAKTLGTLAAQAAISKGISQVVFDRGGSRYHGKVKALADAAREAGLKF